MNHFSFANFRYPKHLPLFIVNWSEPIRVPGPIRKTWLANAVWKELISTTTSSNRYFFLRKCRSRKPTRRRHSFPICPRYWMVSPIICRNTKSYRNWSTRSNLETPAPPSWRPCSSWAICSLKTSIRRRLSPALSNSSLRPIGPPEPAFCNNWNISPNIYSPTRSTIRYFRILQTVSRFYARV